MNDIAGIPYSTAQFQQDGKLLHAPVVPTGTRTLIIASHGWKNGRDQAEDLYRLLFEKVSGYVKDRQALAIIGVIWPSKKFDFGAQAAAGDDGRIRAASMNGQDPEQRQVDIEDDFLAFERVFEDSPNQAVLGELRTLLERIEEPQAQAQFVCALRRLVAIPGDLSDLDGSTVFETGDPLAVFENAGQASAEVGSDGGADDDAIGATGIGDLFDGVGNAVSSLLNLTTYYEMKKRAGTVGAVGLAPLIDRLAEGDGIDRIHLVGHSFGARLVTAAAMHAATPKLGAMFLLQAAFSHNAFSESGYFRKVITTRRLTGPIVITHTANDTAVARLYAIASRVSGDDAAGLGDANDRYGGLGCNGALNLAEEELSHECTELLPAQAPYGLRKGLVHNLESSRFIRDHSDVRGEQVAWVISQGIALT